MRANLEKDPYEVIDISMFHLMIDIWIFNQFWFAAVPSQYLKNSTITKANNNLVDSIFRLCRVVKEVYFDNTELFGFGPGCEGNNIFIVAIAGFNFINWFLWYWYWNKDFKPADQYWKSLILFCKFCDRITIHLFVCCLVLLVGK